MPVTIKGGSATSKTSKSRPAAKRGAKATTRPTTRGTRTTPRKTATKAPAASKNRSSKTDIPERQLERILDGLRDAADLRTELFEAHRDAVEASNRLILDAESQGVPVHMIVEAGKIARQQFYKLLQDAEAGKLGNGQYGAARQRPGRKPAAKPAAKRTAKTATKVAPKRAIKTSAKSAPKSAAKRTIRRKS
jgi:hypothetical protein